MRKALERRPEIIYYAVCGYFILCVLLRLARSSSLEVDESEQAYLTQYLLLGYGGQPPFYNWLQFAVAHMIGLSVFTLSLVKNGTMLAASLLFGLAAREISDERSTGPITILGVLTLPPIFLLIQRDLSHTAAVLFAVALFLYAFFRTLNRPSPLFYMLTGLAVGIGFISKYNFVILPAAAVLAALPNPLWRSRILSPWTGLAALVALLAVAPHGSWLVFHLADASGNTLGGLREGSADGHLPAFVAGTLSLVQTSLTGVAPTIAVFFLVFYRDWRRILAAETPWSRLVGRILLINILILWVIVLCISATHLREKWLAPILVLVPLWLALKIAASGIEARIRLPAMAMVTGILAVGAALMLLVNVYVAPRIHHFSQAHVPYDALAQQIAKEHGKPAMILAAHGILAGNLKILYPDVPAVIPRWPQQSPPRRDMLAYPLLVIWDGEESDPAALPDHMRALVPSVTSGKTVALPFKGGTPDEVTRFTYFWLAEPPSAN